MGGVGTAGPPVQVPAQASSPGVGYQAGSIWDDPQAAAVLQQFGVQRTFPGSGNGGGSPQSAMAGAGKQPLSASAAPVNPDIGPGLGSIFNFNQGGAQSDAPGTRDFSFFGGYFAKNLSPAFGGGGGSEKKFQSRFMPEGGGDKKFQSRFMTPAAPASTPAPAPVQPANPGPIRREDLYGGGT